MSDDSRKQIAFIPGVINSSNMWNELVGYLPTSLEAHTLDCPPFNDVGSIGAALLKELPQRFSLCGFSFGGYVALSMLAQAPERISSVILVGTNDGTDTDRQKSERLQAAARVADGGFTELVAKQIDWLIHQDNLARAELRAALVESALEYGANRFIAHMHACTERPDRSELTKSLRVPVLVVSGASDRVMSIRRQAAMAKAIPNAEFASIEGAGHMVPLERPMEMAALVSRFVLSAR